MIWNTTMAKRNGVFQASKCIAMPQPCKKHAKSVLSMSSLRNSIAMCMFIECSDAEILSTSSLQYYTSLQYILFAVA